MIKLNENAEIVKKIVDLLNENGFQSTFFVGGCWADDNQETLNYIINNGHEIGNHGYFHKDHKELNYEQNKREILNTEKMVYALCGAKTTLFAPPSGSYSSVTLSVADSLGYKTVMWSKDTVDWRDKDTSLIYKRATEGINNGDMVLMHPKSWTYSALSDILKEIKRKNLKVVKVSELIE